MTTNTQSVVFDYRTLRLMIGIFAFSLPFVVWWVAQEPLPSVSASYHTNARDLFVGILFVVAAFLAAYNGHTNWQFWTSKVAALAAAGVALFPTSSACKGTPESTVHFIAAALLFGILAYFCLVPFYRKTRAGSVKQRRRAVVYLLCGGAMVLSMLTVFIADKALSCETMRALRITFWAEAAALWSFGIAWFVAGKAFRVIADQEEQLTFIATAASNTTTTRS